MLKAIRKFVSRIFGKHSEEEKKMAADYVATKDFVARNKNEIELFLKWLEGELSNPCKKWCNFHQIYYYQYLRFLNKVGIIYHELSNNNIPSDKFTSVCPFDPYDSNYITVLNQEETVNIEELLKLNDNWYAPFYPASTDPNVRELSVHEYNALMVYDICKRKIEKLHEILDFQNDPEEFSIKKLGELKKGELRDFWLLALNFERKPFKVKWEKIEKWTFYHNKWGVHGYMDFLKF